MPQFPGLDVSNFQQQIDWPTAARQGHTFALIEAMDGATFHDQTFFPQWDGAGAAGLVKFMYFFWRADQSDDDQLRAWSTLAPTILVNDGVALDCEDDSGAVGNVTDRVVNLLMRMASAFGVLPLFYSSPAWIREHLSDNPATSPRLSQFGLWLAAWGKVVPGPPAPWPFVAFWQDGASSDVPTTGQPADRDWFLGPISRLHLYGKQV